MRKYISLFFIFFLFVSVHGQSTWDKDAGIYVNYDYGFSWALDSELKWKKTIGTERHTLFRAKNEDLQIIVFVNVQRYNLEALGLDIWKQFTFLKNLYTKHIQKLATSKGYDHKLLKFEKTKIFGNHAIRIIGQTDPAPDNLYGEPSVTQYTIRTYDHGLSFSVNIIIATSLNEEMKKENINVESLFNGFKFLAN